MKESAFLFAITCLLVAIAADQGSAEEPVRPLRVLLVGNSQCPTIVHNHFIENLAASDKEARPIRLVGCVKGGATLKSHWEAGTGDDAARGMISAGPWDFVILQEIYNTDGVDFQTYAPQFNELIKSAGAKMVLFSTASILSDYPQGFERLHRLNTEMGKKLGVPVVDASYGYFKYYGAEPTKEQLQTLFGQDQAHPGWWGSYLYACLIYSTMTGRTPVGLAAPAEIPAEAAKELQAAAWAQYQETASNEK